MAEAYDNSHEEEEEDSSDEEVVTNLRNKYSSKTKSQPTPTPTSTTTTTPQLSSQQQSKVSTMLPETDENTLQPVSYWTVTNNTEWILILKETVGLKFLVTPSKGEIKIGWTLEGTICYFKFNCF